MEKSLFVSKTFWFNVLSGAVAVAVAFGFADFVPTDGVDQVAAAVIAVINAANIGLRWVTDQGVHL